MATASKSLLALVLSEIFLVANPSLLRAERSVSSPLNSVGSEIAYEWEYSCSSGGRGCSFTCPGVGGASNVTKLVIHLTNIPLGGRDVAGITYEFSSVEVPRGSGFSITTGIGTLSCQVSGMNLDYSGPPRLSPSKPPDQKTDPSPSQEKS